MSARDKTIVFRALRPKTQQPIYLSPVAMRKYGGKTFTGQGEHETWEALTPKEKSEYGYLVTPDTRIQIKDGYALDLNDPIDAANWKWMKNHPYISKNKEEARWNRDVSFYVQNPEKEARGEIERDEIINEAKNFIYKASTDKLNSVAKALGLPNPDAVSSDEVKKFLKDMAEADAEVIISSFDPKNKGRVHARSKLTDLLRYNIVVQYQGAFHMESNKGVLLGRSEDMVVDFMMSEANYAIVETMMDKLANLTKSSETTPISEEETVETENQ